MKTLKTFKELNEAKSANDDRKAEFTNVNSVIAFVRGTKNFPEIKKKFGLKSTSVNDDLQIIIAPKQDFPWRVVLKAGKFVVSQEFKDRTYLAGKWYKKGEYPTLEEAFDRILNFKRSGE